MINTSTINSEVDIREDISKNFKQERSINQTAFYLGKGADYYYNPSAKFSQETYNYSKLVSELDQILIKNEDVKITFVSLACGSCAKDKIIMEKLLELGHDIPFFGVDSSMAMIQKSNDTLKDTGFKWHLICADFGRSDFKKELDKIIGNYDLKIYLFLGNTFGNLNQGYMADILNNILHKKDYLLLDVIGFENITSLTESKLFKRYLDYLDDPVEIEFFSSPLKFFGIPEDCGEWTLEKKVDPATQGQLFKFGFEIKNTVTLCLDGEQVILSEKEHIDLFKILVYDLNRLSKFLATRKFKLKKQMIGEFVNQLLFQK